jgi:hypothetical protein
VSRDDVERVVRRDFPAAEYSAALSALDEYRTETGMLEDCARVQLAVLKLSLGDLKDLRRHIAVAKQDYRDVLAAAEYPRASIRWSAMHSLADEERQNIYDSDWDQYRRWLERR